MLKRKKRNLLWISSFAVALQRFAHEGVSPQSPSPRRTTPCRLADPRPLQGSQQEYCTFVVRRHSWIRRTLSRLDFVLPFHPIYNQKLLFLIYNYNYYSYSYSYNYKLVPLYYLLLSIMFLQLTMFLYLHLISPSLPPRQRILRKRRWQWLPSPPESSALNAVQQMETK